jgi:phenol hydroxylase P5 protein
VTETHAVRIKPLGRTITCSTDQTILDACLRNAVWIPHSCTHGTCGTCKATLLSGTVDIGDVAGSTLMPQEIAEGRLLLCTAVPTSDVIVEADVQESALPLHPVRDYTGTVVSMEECARDTRRLCLELDRPMDFVAGQYVSVRVPGLNVRRAYSLANPPSDRRRLELQIRLSPGGAATDGWLFRSLETGEQVDLSGPYGGFLMRTDRLEPAIMVAGGTGLAPIKSMIRHVLEGGHPQKLHLYQGARTREDLYDVEFFQALEEAHPEQFTYRPCLSEQAWTGAEGLVTDVLARDFDRARGYTAYVCGPPQMVESATKALVSLRVSSRDIFRENFYDQSDKAVT